MKHYLENDRVILRDWDEKDLENFARMNRDPMIMQHYPAPLDEKATASLVKNFQKHIDKYGYGFFAVEDKKSGAFMGFSGVSHVPSNIPCASAVELAWRLDYGYWGKSYASEIADLLIDYAFNTLKLKELVAYCVVDHQRADHVLRKIGFVQDEENGFSYASKRTQKSSREYNLYRLNP